MCWDVGVGLRGDLERSEELLGVSVLGCGGEVWESVVGGEGRCVGGVEKCEERSGGKTSIWDECGRYVGE